MSRQEWLKKALEKAPKPTASEVAAIRAALPPVGAK